MYHPLLGPLGHSDSSIFTRHGLHQLTIRACNSKCCVVWKHQLYWKLYSGNGMNGFVTSHQHTPCVEGNLYHSKHKLDYKVHIYCFETTTQCKKRPQELVICLPWHPLCRDFSFESLKDRRSQYCQYTAFPLYGSFRLMIIKIA